MQCAGGNFLLADRVYFWVSVQNVHLSHGSEVGVENMHKTPGSHDLYLIGYLTIQT